MYISFEGFLVNFYLDCHSDDLNEGNHKPIGLCYILPMTNCDTLGEITAPILTLDNCLIGQLKGVFNFPIFKLLYDHSLKQMFFSQLFNC